MALAGFFLVETDCNLTFHRDFGAITESPLDFAVHHDDNNRFGMLHADIVKFVLIANFIRFKLFPFAIRLVAPRINNRPIFYLNNPSGTIAINASRGNCISGVVLNRHIGVDCNIAIFKRRVNRNRSVFKFFRSRSVKLTRINDGTSVKSHMGLSVLYIDYSNTFRRNLFITSRNRR